MPEAESRQQGLARSPASPSSPGLAARLPTPNPRLVPPLTLPHRVPSALPPRSPLRSLPPPLRRYPSPRPPWSPHSLSPSHLHPLPVPRAPTAETDPAPPRTRPMGSWGRAVGGAVTSSPLGRPSANGEPGRTAGRARGWGRAAGAPPTRRALGRAQSRDCAAARLGSSAGLRSRTRPAWRWKKRDSGSSRA